MTIDITSFFFNSSIEGGTATSAWATSVGQSKSKHCRIEYEKPGVLELLTGMLYKSIANKDIVDLSAGSQTREILLCSLFDKIFINDQQIEGTSFILVLVREKSKSHDGRLLVSYPPYAKINGEDVNQKTIDAMRNKLGCEAEGCWFVHDISIRNQDELHFSAHIVNKDEPVTYKCKSKERSEEWASLISAKNKSIPFSINSIIEYINETGLLYSPSLIKRFAFSLMAKRFLILSGLAGSGKTQLALAFAKALVEDKEKQMCVVSVGADWTNREPLLGYPNALKSGEYVKPENGVLDLLIEANKPHNASKPFFLILDEMNMSYVERYFADFLSAMESHEAIALWKECNNENESCECEVPERIGLPDNLFIIGTINVDETTYMFSPKVLDRANVIEFKISIDEMDKFLDGIGKIDCSFISSKAAEMGADFVRLANCKEFENEQATTDTLKAFFTELKSVNAEFGYRSATEIFRFISQAHKNDDTAEKMSKEEVLDVAILQKLLPKLHGSRKKLEPALKGLWKLCFEASIKDTMQISRENIEKAIYKESADKILRMYESAYANGFTSFAEA